MMDTLRKVQTLQLRFVESASVNESCASDLLSLVCKLSDAEANSLIDLVALLQGEAQFLRRVSKEIGRSYTDNKFPNTKLYVKS